MKLLLMVAIAAVGLWLLLRPRGAGQSAAAGSLAGSRPIEPGLRPSVAPKLGVAITTSRDVLIEQVRAKGFTGPLSAYSDEQLVRLATETVITTLPDGRVIRTYPNLA